MKVENIFQKQLALVGLIMLLIYVDGAHPSLVGNVWPKGIYNPITGHDMDIFLHPSGISMKHLLGTDTLGRDVLSVLMAATGPSLAMAFTE
jgi:ABC-type dipeptide/oligopeptide/nickel transport system permease subunit